MEWTLGTIISALSLAFSIVSAIIAITVYIVVVKVRLDNLEGKMSKTAEDLDTHRNNEDKHHNKADFERFEKGISKQFEQFQAESKEFRSEIRTQINIIVEALAKPVRNRTTKQ